MNTSYKTAIQFQDLYIPVKMSAGFNQTIREAIHIFHFQSFRCESSQDGTAAGSSQIDRKKTLFHGN